MTSMCSSVCERLPITAELHQALAPYRKPSLWRSLWQLGNSLIPYAILWYLMVWSLEVSYWLTLALSIPATGFLVRLFIISHDCGHGSFFRASWANHLVGRITSFLCFIPYYCWKHEHAIHHANSGDLDNRGVGDISTLTVEEYRQLSAWGRLRYRLYRNPLVLFGIGGLFLFLIRFRFPREGATHREKWSVYQTNVALVLFWTAIGLTLGIWPYLLVQGPITILASASGVWLFYVQHQFEGAYWERHNNWDYVNGALRGSSYYRLSGVLQWFTGNIGFHHVHHLNSAIPNYYLQRCHIENPRLQEVPTLGLIESLRTNRCKLWDEANQRMVGYEALKAPR